MDTAKIRQVTEAVKEVLASTLFLTKKKPIARLAKDIGVSEKALRSLLDDGTVESALDAAKFSNFLHKQETLRAARFSR